MTNTQKPNTQKPVKRTVEVLVTPGHSYFTARFDELVRLGITDQITTSSYVKGDMVLLEEDLDATTFMRAAEVAGWTLKHKVKHAEGFALHGYYPGWKPGPKLADLRDGDVLRATRPVKLSSGATAERLQVRVIEDRRRSVVLSNLDDPRMQTVNFDIDRRWLDRGWEIESRLGEDVQVFSLDGNEMVHFTRLGRCPLDLTDDLVTVVSDDWAGEEALMAARAMGSAVIMAYVSGLVTVTPLTQTTTSEDLRALLGLTSESLEYIAHTPALRRGEYAFGNEESKLTGRWRKNIIAEGAIGYPFGWRDHVAQLGGERDVLAGNIVMLVGVRDHMDGFIPDEPVSAEERRAAWDALLDEHITNLPEYARGADIRTLPGVIDRMYAADFTPSRAASYAKRGAAMKAAV